MSMITMPHILIALEPPLATPIPLQRLNELAGTVATLFFEA
jgi:hypothetical protein